MMCPKQGNTSADRQADRQTDRQITRFLVYLTGDVQKMDVLYSSQRIMADSEKINLYVSGYILTKKSKY